MIALDSSVVVAGFGAWHEQHELARSTLADGPSLAAHTALPSHDQAPARGSLAVAIRPDRSAPQAIIPGWASVPADVSHHSSRRPHRAPNPRRLRRPSPIASWPGGDRSFDSLIDEITIDCYDEGEALQAFQNAFDEDANFPLPGSVIGEDVTVLSVGQSNGRSELTATCTRNSHLYDIALLDVIIHADPRPPNACLPPTAAGWARNGPTGTVTLASTEPGPQTPVTAPNSRIPRRRSSARSRSAARLGPRRSLRPIKRRMRRFPQNPDLGFVGAELLARMAEDEASRQ